MSKYRLKQVQLQRLNGPLQKLGSLTPFLPDDIDAVENFIKNNLSKKGDLPEFKSPTKKGIEQVVVDMSVPFYIITATEDNQVQNFDPRVMRRPYHVYTMDFQMLMNAIILDFSEQCKTKYEYKKLDMVNDIKMIKQPEFYLEQGRLPKIQPILQKDNVYSKLSKPRNAIKQINVKKESEYKYYHAGTGYDNQHDLGLNDHDITYTINEEPHTLKNDVNKMNIDVKKVSELPNSSTFDLLLDQQSKRDILVYGHEDGSLTFQDLLSNQIFRVFGGHSIAVHQISHCNSQSGFHVISFSLDGRLMCTQVPKAGQLRVQFLGYVNSGEDVSTVHAFTGYVLVGCQNSKLLMGLLPFPLQMKFYELFSTKTFNAFTEQNIKFGAVFKIHVVDQTLFLCYDSGHVFVFQNFLQILNEYIELTQKNMKIVIEQTGKYAKMAEKEFILCPHHFFQATNNISYFYVASPIMNGDVFMKQLATSHVTLKSELLEENFQPKLMVESKDYSRTLRKPQISLKEIMNQRTGEIVVSKDQGTLNYIMVAAGNKVLVFDETGIPQKEYEFKTNISTIQSVNRGEIGSKILYQLAQMNAGVRFLRTFWVGTIEGGILFQEIEEWKQ